MKLRHCCLFGAALIALTLASMGTAPESQAGDLFRLDMRYEGDVPSFPTTIVVNAYKNADVPPSAGDLRATGSADFDGSNLSNVVTDGKILITDAFVQGSTFIVQYVANGYRAGGDFESNSAFEVIVGGDSNAFGLHTSCSRPIWIERRYGATPSGSFYIEGGDGDCFIAEGECPTGSKLYRLDGTFCVPCASPAQLTVNIYKSENELKNTASAFFDGNTLSNVVCDVKTCILGARQEGGNLCVDFQTYGTKDNDEFETETSFELVVDGCGAFKLIKLHTSCSRTIFLYDPYPMTPGGTVTFTGGCGECIEGTIPVEDGTWGQIKAIYR